MSIVCANIQISKLMSLEQQKICLEFHRLLNVPQDIMTINVL